MMVRLALQPLTKEKKQGVWDEEENQEEQCYQGKRNELCQEHICIMNPNHYILIWVVEYGKRECRYDGTKNLCIRQEEEGCQDSNRTGAKKLCHCYRMITDVNQESHYYPNIDRKY